MRRALGLITLFVLTACTTASKHPGETAGTSQTPEATAASLTKEVPNVAIILGPGGAKAFAEAGVLKALQDNRIPIQRVVGIEWGSLVGAAFSAHGQSHEVDWKLYRLDQVDLSGRGGFLGFGRDRSVKNLEAYFHDNFGNLDFASMKIPFSCPSRSYWNGTLVWQHKGVVTDALQKCMPFPPLLKIHGGWLAAATQVRDIVEELKAEGYKLVIIVDVMGHDPPFAKEKSDQPQADILLWQDVQRSMLDAESDGTETIRVSTDGIAMDQFDRRKELQQIGEKEGLQAAQALSSKYGF